MDKKLKCPHCGRGVSARPLRAWKYQSFDVKRYECENCKSRFNLYQRPDKSYTIPKSK